MPVTFVPGVLPQHPEDTHPRLKLASHLAAELPAPPAAVNWGSAVADWPMYGNDRAGDCVEAEQGHHEQVLSLVGSGIEVTVPEQAVIKAYEDIAGYVPGDPATDVGTNIQDAMGYWRKTGVGGHRIDAFAQVNQSDMREVTTAIALLGPLSIGVDLPQSAMDQFNAGQEWDVVAHDGGILGGHCIIITGYDPQGLYGVSWGQPVRLTYAFWARYVSEAWVVVSREWVNARTGLDPEGVDLSGLGDEFMQLTGQPNPFPVPAPTPTPAPTPGPPPGPVGDPDAALAVVAHPFVTHHHTGLNARMSTALKTWLAAKGL